MQEGAGFALADLPEVKNVVFAEFPLRTVFSILVAVWRLYPKLENYIEVRCFKSSHRRCSVKKDVLKNFAEFTEKHKCQSLFLSESLNKKETLAQVFPCEFCQIFKNPFFTGHFRATASDISLTGKNDVFRAFFAKTANG